MAKNDVLGNLTSLLSSDFGSGMLKLIAPKIFKTKARTGRPRKITLEQRIGSYVQIGKLLMVWISVSALRRQQKLTQEQGVALMAYTAEHVATIDIVNCFPSSPSWCIKQALLEMGYAEGQIPSLSWDDMLTVVREYAQLMAEGQYKAQLVQELIKAGVPAETANQIYSYPIEYLNQLFAQGAQNAAVQTQEAKTEQPQEAKLKKPKGMGVGALGVKPGKIIDKTAKSG